MHPLISLPRLFRDQGKPGDGRRRMAAHRFRHRLTPSGPRRGLSCRFIGVHAREECSGTSRSAPNRHQPLFSANTGLLSRADPRAGLQRDIQPFLVRPPRLTLPQADRRPQRSRLRKTLGWPILRASEGWGRDDGTTDCSPIIENPPRSTGTGHSPRFYTPGCRYGSLFWGLTGPVLASRLQNCNHGFVVSETMRVSSPSSSWPD